MSHVACRPVNDSVLGEALDDPADIARINKRIKARSLDLLQADNVLAGVDTALWDLLGKRLGEPVWKLLGQKRVTPKRAYGSQLFGDTAQETLEKARRQRAKGFAAVKLGWGPFGHGDVATDADHLAAAREGAHEFFMARAMIDHGGLDFVQIDAGRMGISEARRVAEYAARKDVRFVNHTFNSDLALSASLQPFAGNAKDDICEYPVERKLIGESLVKDRIARDADGMVWAPEAPGLGLEPDEDTIRRFLVDVEIKVAREVLYRTPEVWREGALPPMLKRCSTRAWTEASKTKTLDPLRFHRGKPVFFVRSHRGLHSAKNGTAQASCRCIQTLKISLCSGTLGQGTKSLRDRLRAPRRGAARGL